MRYFLKKSTNKKGTYLQIYYSIYDSDKKQGRNYSFKALGYIDELISKGINNPIKYGQNIVDQLNESSSNFKISDVSLEKNIGYFILNSMVNFLDIEHDFNLMTSHSNFRFNFFQLFKYLCFAQVIEPGSKLKAFEKVLPSIFSNNNNYSYDQILDCINYIGSSYQKFIELFNHHIEKKFPFNYSKSFFDCTNYYFEIDLEDDIRKKGPSKENRKDPIIGQALLLDGNQIPIGMKMYPGNKSEKPYIRELIQDMKEKYNINGKTIQVADKGLNCAQNIYHASIEGSDGYIFSKSIHGKNLNQEEKIWITSENEYNKWIQIKDENGNLKYKYKSCIDKYEYSFLNEEGEKITFKIKEKRIVTYNPKLAIKQKQEIQKQVDKLINNLTLKGIGKQELGDSIKYVVFPRNDEKGNKIKAELNQDKIIEDLNLAGYNLLVTSETNMKETEIYNAYHGLWKIENSFRIMKTYLQARPVYLQKEESIYGHFLICYISLLLLRLLETYVFKNHLSSEEIISFIRNLNITKTRDGSYINNAKLNTTYTFIKERLYLTKLDSVYLTTKDIKNILDCELPID